MTVYFLFFISFILSIGGVGLEAVAQEKPYDYVIKNALVFDGESLVPVKRDLAILGDRVVQMGEIPREEGHEVIEAEGLVASPGFIDIHTHSDFNPFVYPNLGNKVLQGVTTEVIGNCGMSAAPIEGAYADEIANVWRREGVEIPKTIGWKSFGDYRSEVEFQGLETNLVGLVGHGNLRSAVMGMDPRPAGPAEIESMKKLLGQALDDGAFGISFGLVYLPGIFATREELVALCEEAAKYNRMCVFHIRNEGQGLVEAIQEALEIGRTAQAQVHISHLKAAGEKNWTKIQEAFQKIDEARREGLAVTADAYPYTASFAELGVVLPDALYQDPDRTSRFKDPEKRKAALSTLQNYYQKNPLAWDRIRVATVATEKNSHWQGKSLLEIAKESRKTPVEVLVDLLAEEDFKVSAFYFSQSEAVVDQVLSQPYVAVGSDSIADGSASPHPRAYGTFPRVLTRCPKEEAAISNACWGRVIHQMTGLPAQILGLKEKGRIGAGLSADIVLFNPQILQDRSDFNHPKSPPEGIEWVFVNGKPVVRNGRYEPVHSGVFLTSQQ